MSKSHVSMAQRVCKITGNTYDTDELLLDKSLRQSLDKKTIIGWGISPEAQEKIDNGFIALVVIDPDKTEKESDGTITLEGAYRTGEIAYLKHDVAQNIFDKKIEADMIFVDPEIMRYIEKLYKKSISDEN